MENKKEDFIENLLNEIAEDIKKQKEEAQKILEDISKDKSLLGKWLK